MIKQRATLTIPYMKRNVCYHAGTEFILSGCNDEYVFLIPVRSGMLDVSIPVNLAFNILIIEDMHND